jgi:hypothetical protein
MQWNTLAIILDRLCVQPWSALMERAWTAIDGLRLDWSQDGGQRINLVLWQPIKQLMEKAKLRRDERYSLNYANLLIERNEVPALGFDTYVAVQQQPMTEWIPEANSTTYSSSFSISGQHVPSMFESAALTGEPLGMAPAGHHLSFDLGDSTSSNYIKPTSELRHP